MATTEIITLFSGTLSFKSHRVKPLSDFTHAHFNNFNRLNIAVNKSCQLGLGNRAHFGRFHVPAFEQH